jgi:hypothetical protein
MNLELTDAERQLLLDVLQDRLGTLREQIYHSTTSTFTDELKHTKETMEGVLKKLEAEQA